MKRAALSTLGTITCIVILLGFKSAPTRVARPPFVSPLNSSEPPALDTPATSPTVGPRTSPTAFAPITSVAPTHVPESPTASTAPAETQVPAKAPTRSAAPPTKAASASFLGASVQTRYGPVQLKITYAAGRITAVVAVQLPSGRSRDAEINNYAVPILESETLAAQGANINSVSGATYTSDGYVRSLQSALDAARR